MQHSTHDLIVTENEGKFSNFVKKINEFALFWHNITLSLLIIQIIEIYLVRISWLLLT